MWLFVLKNLVFSDRGVINSEQWNLPPALSGLINSCLIINRSIILLLNVSLLIILTIEC